MKRDWSHLAEVAIKAALAAGNTIREKLKEEIAVEHKPAGSSYATQVVTEVDTAAENAILEYLAPTCKTYDLALLTEESEDDQQRFVKDYFWCIDPLDGTLAFIEKRADFAVSIALVSREGKAVIGVVYDPSRDILYHAIAGRGAFRNREPWQLPEPNDYLTYVSDHPLEKAVGKEEIKSIIQKKSADLGADHVKTITGGGLVINAMRVAENRPAFMLKVPKKAEGGGSTWDYAATACIFEELGLTTHTFSGESLKLNPRRTTFMNEEGMFYVTF